MSRAKSGKVGVWDPSLLGLCEYIHFGRVDLF